MGAVEKKWTLLTLLILFSLCLATPLVDSEKAGYLAGIRFLETHPGEIASYTVSDPGGDAFIVYFNITSPDGSQKDFAEYYVDRYNRDVYVSGGYATNLAITESPRLAALFDRYPSAKIEPDLLKTDKADGRRYVWQIRVVANGVNLGTFAYDAGNEKLLSDKDIKTPPVYNFQPT